MDEAQVFYRAIREIAIDTSASQEQMEQIIDSMEIPMALEPALRAVLDAPPVTKRQIPKTLAKEGFHHGTAMQYIHSNIP